MPQFESLSLPVLAAIFAASAVIVWKAGTRMSNYAALISDRTGIGGAVIGVVLLGFATSLPEVATSVTASVRGEAQLAVNSLLGGVAFQVVVLAIADAAIGKDALTALVPSTKVMQNAVASILLLAIAILGITIGDVAVGPVGLSALLIGGIYALTVWRLRESGGKGGWKPVTEGIEEVETAPSHVSNRRLALFTILAAAVILAAGFLLMRSAEGIAAATGADTGLLGLTLLAAATSLPEVSTAIAAVRLRQSEMAIGDILGGNMFDTLLILLVDVIYAGAPVLAEVDSDAATAAVLGIILTGIVLIGMIERKDRTILRMGYDSLSVILVYCAGIALIVAGAGSG